MTAPTALESAPPRTSTCSAVVAPAGNHPTTSTTTFVARMSVLSLLFQIEIDPSAPTLATTRLATVCPPAKLSDDARGRVSPVGHVVRYPPASVPVAVRLRMTAP